MGLGRPTSALQHPGTAGSLVACSLTVGGTGAVSKVVGPGFTNSSFVRDDVGRYTVTLPGSGGLTGMVASQPLVEDTVDTHKVTLVAKDLAARTAQFQCWGPTAADDNAQIATELTSGTILHFTFVIFDGNLG